MSNRHKCKALVISCIDFRFVTKVRDFLVKERLKDNYDLITVPGASLGLENITSSILTSLQLHDPSIIYIFDHEDCGAYGKNNSKKAHTDNLKGAQRILLEDNPNKQVRIFITGFTKIEEIY